MQMTVKDAANVLNVAEKTVYRWIQSGGLPAYRVAGQYRINRAMLFEWATAKRVNFNSDDSAKTAIPSELPAFADAIREGGIHYRVGGSAKPDALRSVVGLLRVPDSVDREALCQAMLAREQLQSTGVGEGIALPHVRNPAMLEVTSPMICLCFLENPIEYGALDGKPVKTLFVPLASSVRVHLHLLARISFALRNPKFRKKLDAEDSRESILEAARNLEPDAAPES